MVSVVLNRKYCNFPISSDVTGHRLAVRTKYFECHRSQWSCPNRFQMSQGSPREYCKHSCKLLIFFLAGVRNFALSHSSQGDCPNQKISELEISPIRWFSTLPNFLM